MHKNELSRDRKKVIRLPIEDVTRARPANTAYGLYAQKASLRFEFEGRKETIRQLRAKVALCEAIGEHTMSEQIRHIVDRVQPHRPRDCGIHRRSES